MRHVRVWPVLGLLAGFAAWPFTARPGGQVWPVLTAFLACLRQRRWSVGNSQPPHVFIDGNSINARYSGNFPVRMAGAVQGFDRLYAGHGQLIGHARLSRHFRAKIAQQNQPLQWPVLTVHPCLLWVKAQTAAVEEDRRFEILAVSEAACTAFD
ncbi:MAG: hypothetical protein RLZZ536_754 [Planctomycetota bacterium]